DDAYIHFRIAEHLATHGVPCFNVDEPVMGSSSAAWTIVLATVFKLLPFAGLTAISVFNAMLTTAAVYVYARVLAHLRGVDDCFSDLGAALLTVPILLPSSIGLMEVPGALLVLGTAMLLYLRSNVWAFALFAAAVFVRLELVLFLGVFGV